ncbi:hypothetical protein RSAG8_08210, partial [Rhizoctonia solani AG-8 WAC10335]
MANTNQTAVTDLVPTNEPSMATLLEWEVCSPSLISIPSVRSFEDQTATYPKFIR